MLSEVEKLSEFEKMREFEKLREFENEMDCVAFGEKIGACLHAGICVYLQGTLGAGKTTLCRGILKAFGHLGAVKSPTYTVVEPYEFAQITIYHFDLYRLRDGEELEFIGIRDYFNERSVCLVEWPERGAGWLPAADLVLQLRVEQHKHLLECRQGSNAGGQILKVLRESLSGN